MIDTPAVLVLGLVLAQLEPVQPGARFVRESAFRQGFALTLLIFLVAYASYRVAPDWMSMYFLRDPAFTALGLGYVFLLLYAVPYLAAYALGAALRHRSRVRGLLLAAFGLALQVAVVRHVWPRYLPVGSFDEWTAGRGTPLPEHGALNLVSLPGGALVVLGFAVAAAAAYRRMRAAGEPVFNAVEREVLAAAIERWYALPFAEAQVAAERAAAYLTDAARLDRALLKCSLWLLEWTPLLLVGRPRRFSRLRPELMDRHLARVDHSRFALWRFLLAGVRIVVGMLHYEALGSRLSTNPACPPPARS